MKASGGWQVLAEAGYVGYGMDAPGYHSQQSFSKFPHQQPARSFLGMHFEGGTARKSFTLDVNEAAKRFCRNASDPNLDRDHVTLIDPEGVAVAIWRSGGGPGRPDSLDVRVDRLSEAVIEEIVKTTFVNEANPNPDGRWRKQTLVQKWTGEIGKSEQLVDEETKTI